MDDVQPISQSQVKRRGMTKWPVLISVFLLVLVIAAVYVFNVPSQTLLQRWCARSTAQPLNQGNEQRYPLNDETPSQHISDVSSQYQAFVKTTSEGLIEVTPLDQAKEPYTVTKYGKQYDGGSLGLGSTGVALAPDLQKYALITAEGVTVVSTDGKIEEKIPLKGARYLTDWSPDAKRLLIYVQPQTIKETLIPEMGYSESPDTFTVGQDYVAPGFVVIDFQAGTMRQLTELSGMLVHAWAGNNALVLSTGDGQYEQFAHYNLDTGTVDTKAVAVLGEVFGAQLSFTEDGKKWATVSSTEANSTDLAKVTFGTFPNLDDLGTLTFPWASRQMPMVSPDGERVALRGYEIVNGPDYLFLFDGKTLEQVTRCRPELWVDNQQVLCTDQESVYLYNIDSKAKTTLQE